MLCEGSIRVGLIGCGRIAPRHVQALDSIPELRLVAVCDRVMSRARRIAAGTGAAPYASHLEMLERERLDLVAVLTESGTHAHVGADAAARAPVVVVEKPMALTVEDADRLVASCDGAGSRLFVVKQNRFNPPIVRLREALDAGRFGNIVMGTVRMRWCRDQAYYDQDPWRGTWAMDGGVLANQACHYVDVLQWMLGPVAAVKGYTATRLAHIEAPDTVVAILRAASGALGLLEATTATRPSDLEGSLALLGEGGGRLPSAGSPSTAWRPGNSSGRYPATHTQPPVRSTLRTPTASVTRHSIATLSTASAPAVVPCSREPRVASPWNSSRPSTLRPSPATRYGFARSRSGCWTPRALAPSPRSAATSEGTALPG